MKSSILSLIALLAASFTANAVVYNLSGTMDVLQAGTNGGFGAGTGSGTGTISGGYDDVTNLLDYTLTWQNLSGPITVAHFHGAAPGASGGVQLGISGPYTSPLSASGITLTESQESNLLGELWYVNLHTSAFTGGEIRGQVLVTAVPEPSTLAFVTMMLFAGIFGSRKRRV